MGREVSCYLVPTSLGRQDIIADFRSRGSAEATIYQAVRHVDRTKPFHQIANCLAKVLCESRNDSDIGNRVTSGNTDVF